MPDGYLTATRRPVPLAEPFATAEDCWLWTAQTLLARREGVRCRAGIGGNGIKPCTPDDVLNILNRLYYRRRIDLIHARVLRHWGDIGWPPDPTALSEMRDHAIWVDALDRMHLPLKIKGIVV
jgi:hypothetical protein